MDLTRRDFLMASSAIGTAFGIDSGGVMGAPADGLPSVVWLQAQSCSGCSVSLLNSIFYDSADSLLVNTLNLEYHPTLMAAAGKTAVEAAMAARQKGGYILVVEGSIPTDADGAYCQLWPGTNALAGVQDFASGAAFVLAVGTCSAYGGVVAGLPNPTGARSLGQCVGVSRVVNIPGCPSHPDWVVWTIAYLLKNGQVPPLDGLRRPTQFFSESVHEDCPFEDDDEGRGQGGHCLEYLGCKGKKTRADCPTRRWNSGATATPGVNWCVAAGSPCHGCTEPGFPDGMSPFYSGGESGSERDEEDDEERERQESGEDRRESDEPTSREDDERQDRERQEDIPESRPERRRRYLEERREEQEARRRREEERLQALEQEAERKRQAYEESMARRRKAYADGKTERSLRYDERLRD